LISIHLSLALFDGVEGEKRKKFCYISYLILPYLITLSHFSGEGQKCGFPPFFVGPKCGFPELAGPCRNIISANTAKGF
jgi:hypothetical protein